MSFTTGQEPSRGRSFENFIAGTTLFMVRNIMPASLLPFMSYKHQARQSKR
jgi:hypothetical protein